MTALTQRNWLYMRTLEPAYEQGKGGCRFGIFHFGRRTPVKPDGASERYGHPKGTCGARTTCEIYKQLQGKALLPPLDKKPRKWIFPVPSNIPLGQKLGLFLQTRSENRNTGLSPRHGLFKIGAKSNLSLTRHSREISI